MKPKHHTIEESSVLKFFPNANEADTVVQEENGDWYFFVETWCHVVGPYATREEAIVAVNQYALEL